jgi:Mce-associated membrane protein
VTGKQANTAEVDRPEVASPEVNMAETAEPDRCEGDVIVADSDVISADSDELYDTDEPPGEEMFEGEATKPERRRRFRPRAVATAPARAVRATWCFSVRRSVSLIAAFGILAILLAAGAGWLQWQRMQQSSVDDARTSAAIAATTGVTAVLSYSYKSFNADAAKGEAALTGSFRGEYTQLMAKEVASVAKQQQATTSAQVASSSVISATPSTVKMLLFVDQTTTATSFSGPKLDGGRVVVTLNKTGGKWLISAIQPV